MSYRSGVLTGFLLAALLGGGVAGAWWLWNTKLSDAKKITPPPIPASVAKPLKEEQLNTVTLTAEAEKLLALQTATVERKKLRRNRTYGGEVMVPAGQTVLVAAPLSGLLRATSQAMPLPGQMVKRGQPMFELLPLLTPEGRAKLTTDKVDADAKVKNAETRLDGAMQVFSRTRQAVSDGTGFAKQVEEAQMQVSLAQEELKGAKAIRDQLTRIMGEVERGTAAAFVIESPTDGMLRNLSVRTGQTVPSGAALFELFEPGRMWVRVPVYVGEMHELDLHHTAGITSLNAQPGAKGQQASPVHAPPSANAVAGTVDLFYELDNHELKYSPAHRVSVTIDLNDEAESLAVPWAAVVHDVYGGAWVYVKAAEHTFIRQRVVVKFVKDGLAALSQGPNVGTPVVTAGAAELFGTETGFSK